jgi:hypothetical protein
VIQKSTDRGKSFGPMSYVSPGFPASGGDSAPLVVEPSGRIDVLYQGYQITNARTDELGPAYSYFTSSVDQGSTWSRAVRVGRQAGTMSPSEWWIDGDISLDSAGNLYATWDTQGQTPAGAATDTGSLSSLDRPRSALVGANPGTQRSARGAAYHRGHRRWSRHRLHQLAL